MANEQFQFHPIVNYGGRQVRDFTRHARFFAKIKEDDSICADYIVEEGETPTQLAQDFYGDPKLFWVLLNLNDVINPWFDWPMDYNNLIRYTASKYDLNSETDVYQTQFYGFDDFWFSQNRLFEAGLMYPQYMDENGNFLENDFKDDASPMSYLEYEGMLNDARRLIRVVRPDEISNVVNDYRDEIRA